MIDFKKLNDPAWRAERAAERAAEEAAADAREKENRAHLDRCFDHYEALSERERSFVTSCRLRLNQYLTLSEKQEIWLKDISERLDAPAPDEDRAAPARRGIFKRH